MLIGVFGTPSPLTLWTLHAVRIIIQVVHPNFSYISAVRFEDMKAAWNAIDANARQQILFFIDCPEAPIADLFVSMDVPILWIADDAEDIVPFCQASRLMQVEQAIRFMTQSAATLSHLFRAKYLWQIRKEFYGCRVVEFVRNLIKFFGLSVRDGEFKTIIGYLAPGDENEVTIGEETVRLIDKARWPGTYEFNNAWERGLFEMVGPQYDRLLRNQGIDHFFWPRDVFSDWDRPGQLVRGVQNMMGRARYLICGPYLHLPRGAWRAHVEIEVTENLSGNNLHADVLNGSVMVTGVNARLPKLGAFALDMDFVIREPLMPVEVRLEIREGAIEGKLLLRGVQLTRTAELSDPVPNSDVNVPLLDPGLTARVINASQPRQLAPSD
jgi:hypothetical protein